MNKLTILVPAYNEEATIVQILEKVQAQKPHVPEMEVLVVDDGSKDRTIERLEARPELYTKLIRMPKNGGKGAAVQEGLRQATGDYILFQDADLEYDPADYKNLCYPATDWKADVVMGARFGGSPVTRVAYFWNLVGNKLITTTFNVMHSTTFNDIYTCYFMFRRDLVKPDELRKMGWDQQAEILSLAVQRGKVLYQVPIAYHGRTYEEGKKIRPYHALGVLWTIVATKLFRS